MDLSKLLPSIVLPLLGLFLGLVFLAIFFGMVVGLFTYGRPMKKQRGDVLLDDALGIGEGISHRIIDLVKGRLKDGTREGTWLNDQQILAMMRGMKPGEFEEFIAQMFTALGYQTRLNGGSGDGGVDIEMTKDGRSHLVQCKKYINRKVNPHDVRDFFGAMGDSHSDGKGFFITTNIFTLQTEQWAENKPIELIDGTRLIQLVRDSGVIGNQTRKQAVSETKSETKELCPKCGSLLVKRTNRESGKQFLGCSRYPDCTFTK